MVARFPWGRLPKVIRYGGRGLLKKHKTLLCIKEGFDLIKIK